jgi:hypothetical protein
MYLSGMNEHLRKARAALEREGRYVAGRDPTPKDLLETIREILAYLEEIDRNPPFVINQQP